jgi:hypothetical protein
MQVKNCSYMQQNTITPNIIIFTDVAEVCEVHTLSDVLAALHADSFDQTKRTECDQTVAQCLPPCHSSLPEIFVTSHHVPGR